MGIPGPRDRRRTGGAPRIPRPARLRGPARRGLSGRRADSGKPLQPRPGGCLVPSEGLAEYFGRVLDLLDPAATEAARAPQLPPRVARDAGDAWDAVVRSRDPRRPSTVQLLQHGAGSVVLLRGAGDGARDHGILLALARFGRTTCVVVGHQRDRPGRAEGADAGAADPLPAAFGPASLRDARRGMRLAKELRLPLVTVIDTAGAPLSREAEEGGLAAEIARSLYDLLGLDIPTVSVLPAEPQEFCRRMGDAIANQLEALAGRAKDGPKDLSERRPRYRALIG
ncbi:carboxyl transferase domain-containing protein [Pseudarthrobacter sp. S9]|uniref:carboxyl transferase domain-containing protein n=1 Tax=Pseudarthrobacter sp. S9 TaxID=3418421 RepID=UPI003CFDAA41